MEGFFCGGMGGKARLSTNIMLDIFLSQKITDGLFFTWTDTKTKASSVLFCFLSPSACEEIPL